MKPVCVLGNGQLGRMLRQAGSRWGSPSTLSGLMLNRKACLSARASLPPKSNAGRKPR
ncbi:Uncharacterised protein [Tatumella ptyseos]|uniref:Uncharacterized protein n=1 Tax=Tatumella ptyseos TaxID=82987 RepID=A0A2X5P6G8_9GAMM|nr:Uncharacterised protein [Tatumella ptyseos]